MDMTISEKDKNLLVILGGVLLLAGTYYYGYQNLTARTAETVTQNEILTQQTGLLQQLSANKQKYETDTQKFITDSKQLISRYPAAVHEEDEIMYADSLTESITGTYVSYAATPPGETLALQMPVREDLLVSSQDVTGAIRQNAYVPDGTVPDVTGYALCRSQSDMSFQTSYAGMKAVLNDITGSENVKGIDSITLAYDDSTGYLTGTVTVNFYSLSGTDRKYTEPKTDSAAHGTQNIFGTAQAVERVQKAEGGTDSAAAASSAKAEKKNAGGAQ